MKTKLTLAALALILSASALVTTASPASARTAFPPYVYQVIRQGRCDWLRGPIARAGLPSIFVLIAARESGCARNGVNHSSRTDLSTSRFGINYRTPALRRGWGRLCGVTDYRALRNLSLDLRCTKAAYRSLGLRPWR